VRRSHALIRDVPFAYANALLNPIVGCVYQACQFRIREQFRRHISGHSRDLRGDALPHDAVPSEFVSSIFLQMKRDSTQSSTA
jgi:hypothetical protein